ncbi:hypothetical protein CQ019_06030 [Arthrobacter sp. MYb229]|nr:hypothetical protein CQ019_06030 [Arthrobacter sp. MYb229]PRB47854.1 hypothetical protein CQ013_15825 [Arthrobacter sp. MYb216]
MPPVKTQTHRDFAEAWLPALQRDVLQQLPVWEEIVTMVDPSVPITVLRALDIVGWDLGRAPRSG